MMSHFLFRTKLHALIVLALACISTQPAWAGSQTAFQTPPSQLDGLSQSQLNEFGMSLANEAFERHSRVGSPSGETGGTQNMTDPNAVQEVKAMFDDDAIIQSARLNFGLTKATYEPNDVDEYKISDMVISRPSEDVLVASFNVALPNRVDLSSGIVFEGESRPRLVVLRWNNEARQWKIFTSADFDTPYAVLCNKDSSYKPQKSQFEESANALAKQLMDELMQSSLNNTEKSVQAKGLQYVFASGERKTSSGPIRAKMKRLVVPENIEAIRSGSLLAVRFDSMSTLTLDGGNVETGLRPRLFTFQLDPDGRWRVAAMAIFSVTEKVKDGISCIQPSVE
jgi:hypothetical protein